MLNDHAAFDEEQLTFHLLKEFDRPGNQSAIPAGRYSLKRRENIPHHYRIHHPLAELLIDQAANQSVNADATLQFDYTNTPRKITVLEPLVGQTGTLLARKISITSLETEDHIIVAAQTDAGETLDAEQARRLFNLPGSTVTSTSAPNEQIEEVYQKLRKTIIADITDRNGKFFDEEMDKLDRWASDKRTSQKEQLREYDDEITSMKKESRTARNLQEKIEIRKKVQKLEAKREEAWKEYDKASKEIETQKDGLIDKVESRLEQGMTETTLFKVRWSLV